MGFCWYYTINSTIFLTSDTTYYNDIQIVDAYSKIRKFYGMEKITSEEIMDTLDMFQSRFGKLDEFGWWDLEIISEDAGKQFISTDFKEECQTRQVYLTLEVLDNQEINGQVEVTRITLRTITQYLMVHTTVLEAYNHFTSIYTKDHIFTVIPIKDMKNKYGNQNTSFKIATGKQPSVSHLRALFFPCGVRKATLHVYKKTINTCHQAQKGLCRIFVGIPQHQKRYLVYIPITRKIIY